MPVQSLPAPHASPPASHTCWLLSPRHMQAVISWTGGKSEAIYKLEVIPTITIYDIM